MCVCVCVCVCERESVNMLYGVLAIFFFYQKYELTSTKATIIIITEGSWRSMG